MNKKKILIIIGAIILLGVILYLAVSTNNKKEQNITNDNERFANEYKTVTKDNVFVYRDINEIINILEKGTGVVYLGFPECPWCKAYVTYLNEVAKVYYYNILEDRKNNTKEYQKIIELLGDYVANDEEGNKRIYVPMVIGVNKGQIVGFDDETAWDTKGYETPEDYWSQEDLQGLKDKLAKMFQDTKSNICTSDCNK